MKRLFVFFAAVAAFHAPVLAIRAAVESAADTVYATSDYGSGPVEAGQPGCRTVFVNECEPIPYIEFEIFLSGGVPGKVYYFEAAVQGAIVEFISSDFAPDTNYGLALVQLEGDDVDYMPSHDAFLNNFGSQYESLKVEHVFFIK